MRLPAKLQVEYDSSMYVVFPPTLASVFYFSRSFDGHHNLSFVTIMKLDAFVLKHALWFESSILADTYDLVPSYLCSVVVNYSVHDV